MKNATLITGITLLIVGTTLYIKYDTMTKQFSLGANLIGAGIAFVMLSIILRWNKWKLKIG